MASRASSNSRFSAATRLCLEVALDGGAHGVLELVEGFHAETLGERVVDRDLAGGLHLLDGHVEGGVLAGEVLRLVVGREGDPDLARIAGFGADELVLEAGNEGAGAELELDAVAGAALERLAVDRADEVDDEPVAGGGLGPLALRREGAVLLGHALERFLDLGVGHPRGQLLHGNVGQVGELEARQHLQGDREGEIGLGLHGPLDLVLVLRELDLRIEGELELVLVDDLAVGLVDGVLHDIGHDRAAVKAAQVLHRHLAGPKAIDAHAVLEGSKLAGQALLQLGRRQHHLELALEALGQGFRHLHGRITSTSLNATLGNDGSPESAFALVRAMQRCRRPWCGRRGSNPHDFRHWNLNPARLPVPPRPRGRGAARPPPGAAL